MSIPLFFLSFVFIMGFLTFSLERKSKQKVQCRHDRSAHAAGPARRAPILTGIKVFL
jgi:hypothetical protein